MKILLLGDELFHADGRTDGQTDRRTNMTKLSDAFRNFAKASKMFKLPSGRNIC